MTLVNIRLWGKPDEVAEATRRLGRALKLVQESEPYQGRKTSGEEWRRLTIDLETELAMAYDPNMMWSVFAGMFYLQRIHLRTRENLVEDIEAEPILQALFLEMGNSPEGRAVLQQARAEWDAHGAAPPWESVLGPLDLEPEARARAQAQLTQADSRGNEAEITLYTARDLAVNPLAQRILQDIALTPEGRAALRAQRSLWEGQGSAPPWEVVLGAIDSEPAP